MKSNHIHMLFDLDGTLVHSLPDITGVINRIRRDRGLAALAPQEIKGFIGKGVEHLIRGSFPGTAPSEFPALVEAVKAIYYVTPSMGGNLYPGVREGLDRLRATAGRRLAVATNKPTVAAEMTLSHYLPGFAFDEVAGPERVTAKKPSPLHLLEVIERLGVKKEDCWYLGDDDVDFQAAQAAGVNFLAAGYGFGTLSVTPPERLISRFDEIFERIPGLGNGR